MGKKSKKSFYKKQMKPFVKDNNVLLAALGGAVAGITLANVLGNEKAQQILNTIESSIQNVASKFTGPAETANEKKSLKDRGNKLSAV